MTYRERREQKADRLREWAGKREAKAEAGAERARDMASVIPFGQPILVGHHSEGRDRRYRDRISATYDRAFEDARKAADMAGRADGIDDQLARSIYSDDADAVDRLTERVDDLEAERDRIKRYNASCRRGAPDRSVLDDGQRANLDSVTRHAPYQLGKGGAFPSYVLSNLSGNIKRNRDRLTGLATQRARQESTAEAGGVLIEELPGGYVRVTFAEKPDRDTLAELRSAGFRWGRGSWTGQAHRFPHWHPHWPEPGTVGPVSAPGYWHRHAGWADHEHTTAPPTCSTSCGFSPSHAGDCQDGPR